MLHGVDVSTYQPGWTPDQNDKFVFVKSTEGSTWTSGQAAAQLKAARDKRLQVGHYHFMRPGNAVRQARWFVAKTDINSATCWSATGRTPRRATPGHGRPRLHRRSQAAAAEQPGRAVLQ